MPPWIQEDISYQKTNMERKFFLHTFKPVSRLYWARQGQGVLTLLPTFLEAPSGDLFNSNHHCQVDRQSFIFSRFCPLYQKYAHGIVILSCPAYLKKHTGKGTENGSQNDKASTTCHLAAQFQILGAAVRALDRSDFQSFSTWSLVSFLRKIKAKNILPHVTEDKTQKT